MIKKQIPEIKISVRFKNRVRQEDLYKLNHSEDTAELCRMLFDDGQIKWTESMIVICLNRANIVLGYYKLSQGGITATVADPRVIFTLCLNLPGTCNIILSHNHPSGNLQPSRADQELTAKIKNAGEMLDIKLLDHVIVADEGYYSFADNCIL